MNLQPEDRPARPGDVDTPTSASSKRTAKLARRPSTASRSGGPSETGAYTGGNDLATKKNVNSLASSRGMDVREQNNKIMIQTQDGKTLQFENYAAAEAYLQGSGQGTKVVKKAAPVETMGVTPQALEATEGDNDIAGFQAKAEQLGARVMAQKNGSVIVFAPEWNPPLLGRQFSNANEAEVWLTDEYGKRGNEELVQKNFTPLDQGDTPADTLPPVKKKSGATPQLTANLDLQESVAYSTWRNRQV